MPSNPLLNQPEFRAAFLTHERQERISTGKLGSALVLVLMPFGWSLDLFVYPDYKWDFLWLRLICSALAGVLWYLHTIPFGQRHYKAFGLPIAFLPALFITCMIYATEGPHSPYYAGLNLILLAVSVVVHWGTVESLTAVAGIMLMYAGACAFYVVGHADSRLDGTFYSNLTFMLETGVIVVAGNHFFNLLRFREFALSYELNRNKIALEESNQKLKELDEVKGRFFANISHELRTPLTLLLAPLETIQRKYSRTLDDESRNLLVTMQSNGMRLLKLINDLLDLVRMESGVMQVKADPLEVDEFVKGLAAAARQVAVDKRIALETFVDPELGTVLGDRDKLEKIVLNLVFNALKFTPGGGRVELRAEKQDEQFVLIVADTGMGISAKNIGNIFSRFWQADDSSKRKYQGVGIGLALVKELAEVQGGSAHVASEEGKGTTFTVRLPFKKAAAGQKAAPVEMPQPATTGTAPAETTQPVTGTVSSQEWLSSLYRRAELFPAMTPLQDTLKQVENTRNGHLPKLLVADDEPDMLRFLKSQLDPHYQVIEAVDGQQAIEKAGQFLPSIILLDMMMPEKDGLQACREIRAHTPTQSIPIILITARADEDTKLAALEAGASDFLSKPFSTTELHVRVKNLVDSNQYQLKLGKQNQMLESTIEQLKDTETQLVQSEKLNSLGRMSAGIIHEINNPLNFATTGLYTLRNKGKFIAPEQKDEYDDILKDVEEGIKRVKDIVSDLRQFTHPDTKSREQVDVADLVHTAVRFLSGELKSVVRIEQKLAEGQTVWANKNKLIHVIVNLLQNSFDAMKGKEYANGEQPAILIEGKIENGLSLLTVRDNGPGIKKDNLNKIFDPFFTTKDVGQGMGLGLSICYRIVEDYDGRIAVRTEEGKFCEFTLEFLLRDEINKNE